MAVLCVSLFLFYLLQGPVCTATTCGYEEPACATTTCGYESCKEVKEGMLNVHLVPHTHDDPGWLKTVDQYYYGANNTIQRVGIQYVIDSIIPELLKDETKRFIYIEMVYMTRWWREQTDSMRHTVQKLVNEGRLEFILGSWCMNDEATTHYNAIIDQHTLGFEFIRHTFGECGRPRVAWQIDPFGHSREQASLFAQMGYDGLFFGRLDYQDKNLRMKSKRMEMLWRGSPKNLGKTADLFSGVLYNGYAPPKGFCFDISCDDDPIMDDDRMHDYNLPEKIESFINQTRAWIWPSLAVGELVSPAGSDNNLNLNAGVLKLRQADAYATNHILMPMGGDFNYQNANTWFKNTDKLIRYINEKSNITKIHLFYSTPSCYLYSLNKANKQWPTKEDDFFPYAHRAHSFWTGYFTSRPALKGYVRQTNTVLQICKQLDALAGLQDTDNSTYNIQILKDAMATTQHHDAVSGTERQHVAYDYAQRLANGVFECQKVMNDAITTLLPRDNKTSPPGQEFCNLLNISACHITENYKQFTLMVYNPLGKTVTSWVRLPVAGDVYKVLGPDGHPVPVQVIPVSKVTKTIPERKSIADNELVFKTSAPPLGFSVYFIQKKNKMRRLRFKQRTKKRRLGTKGNADTVMKNAHVSLTFDGTTGDLKSMRNLDSGIGIGVHQDFLYYQGFAGNNTIDNLQASGAYIFRPNTTNAIRPFHIQKSVVKEGRLVQEMHQQFAPYVSQVVRLYEGEMYAEFEWTVGPIPVDDGIGKEIVSRFTTTLSSDGSFYTDANGREILKRERNKRATWSFNQTEPVAGNFYPVNSRIYIRDEEMGIQFTVLTDRAQGGSSITDGSLQLMVHRRLLYDDALGVGEALNETGADHKGLIVRGKHYIFLGRVEKSNAFHRDMALRLYMPPYLSFTSSAMKYPEWSTKFQTNWAGMKSELPSNVHLLTLEQWGGPGVVPSHSQPYLIRLEHIFERDEHSELSKAVKVDLRDLFATFTVDNLTELTLGANMVLSDLHRLQWNATNVNEDIIRDESIEKPLDNVGNSTEVKLEPMQIRTFQVQIDRQGVRGGY